MAIENFDWGLSPEEHNAVMTQPDMLIRPFDGLAGAIFMQAYEATGDETAHEVGLITSGIYAAAQMQSKRSLEAAQSFLFQILRIDDESGGGISASVPRQELEGLAARAESEDESCVEPTWKAACNILDQISPYFMTRFRDWAAQVGIDYRRHWNSALAPDEQQPTPGTALAESEGADGDGDQADQASPLAMTEYDSNLLTNARWEPLDGRYEFEVQPDGFWVRLTSNGNYVVDVRNNFRLKPGNEGTIDVGQGVPGEVTVTVGALAKVDPGQLTQRNIAALDALVADCSTGEKRVISVFFAEGVGMVLVENTDAFDAVAELGRNVRSGQIMFIRNRMSANEFRINGHVDKDRVKQLLRELIDGSNYPYRDRTRVKIT